MLLLGPKILIQGVTDASNIFFIYFYGVTGFFWFVNLTLF